MTTKKELLDGFVMEPHGGSGNRALPRVVPIEKGRLPRRRHCGGDALGGMKAAFKGFEELAFGQVRRRGPSLREILRQAEGQNPRLREAPRRRLCAVRRVADAFVFTIVDQVSIEPQ